VEWIHLAQDIRCRAFVNTVMNLRVPYKWYIYWPVWRLSASERRLRTQLVVIGFILTSQEVS